MDLARFVDHPLRKQRRVLQRVAPGDGPMVVPARPFAHILIWRAECTISKSIIEGNELIATLPQQVNQFADMVSFQPITVKQQNLLGLVTEQVLPYLLEVIEY